MANQVIMPDSKYYPDPNKSQAKNVGDVESARAHFLANRPTNLEFMLQNRYKWMNKYLDGLDYIFELGSGSGLSKEWIDSQKLKLTDVIDYSWIDERIDATNLSFSENSVDAFICSHMIHHLAYPKKFLDQAFTCLKPDGILLIQDVSCSILMRLLMRIVQNEGWDYNLNVYDATKAVNDERDLWSGNNAVADLLFTDQKKFHANFPGFEIEYFERCECLTVLISGGVVSKTPTISLPKFILKLLLQADNLLVKLFPQIFSLGLRVVIRKNKAT